MTYTFDVLRAPSADPAVAEALDPAHALQSLVRSGFADLPLPAQGDTLTRWRALASIAERDLGLVKLFEGHTDALAIMAELGVDLAEPDSTWAVWAAEPPNARVTATPWSDARHGMHSAFTRDARPFARSLEHIAYVELNGTKAWCSGARGVSHALLTVWDERGEGPWLAAVALDHDGVSFDDAHWNAVGMARTRSIDVRFDRVPALRIGELRAYLERPGFWHGGAGIAACWHGAAHGLAQALHASVREAGAQAHWSRTQALGAIDVALSANAALLRDTARWMDAHPRDDAMTHALRVRASSEACAQQVLLEVGRALGATPFCRDPRFAALAADLPVFVRQSHGERDLAALGARAATHGIAPGAL